MKTLKLFLISILLMSFSFLSATTYYVSTTGSNSNNGTTLATPFLTIAYALTKATTAGDIIYVRSGTYAITSRLNINTASGTSAAKITLSAYPSDVTSAYPADGRPVLDFSGMAVGSSNQGCQMSGVDYWYLYGLRFKGAGDNGMLLQNTNYSTIEFCEFYQNRDAGFQIRYLSHDDLILNCDADQNADMGTGTSTNGGNADGFSPKLDLGTNVIFRGCRSWYNSDDGWDGYLKATDGSPAVPDGMLTILENCWAWHNGYYWADGTTGSSMNGNGIKMGGSGNKDQAHNFRVINCLSFNNKAKGFDQNNNAGSMWLYNCTSYNNGAGDFELNASGVSYVSGAVTSVINCTTPGGATAFKAGSTLTTNNFTAATTAFTAVATNSTITNATLNITAAENQCSAMRKADGSLPDITFMHLAAASPLIDAGTIQAAVPYYGGTGIPYNGTKPDIGCFETVTNPTLTLTSGTASQTVSVGTAITPIVYTWGGTATGVTMTGSFPAGVAGVSNAGAKTYTISGTPTAAGAFTYTLTTTQSSGTAATATGTITAVALVAPTLALTAGTASQSVLLTSAITNIVYTWGGGATDVTVTSLPAGVIATKDVVAKTVTLSGTPTAVGATTYSIVTIGGLAPMVTKTGTITVTTPVILGTPTGVTATSTSSTVTINWSPVTNATGYVINFCTTPTNTVIQSWDFSTWTISLANADANLVQDGTNARFNYIPATTNTALLFANGTAIPDVAGLLFTQTGATKVRLGYGTGCLYLNGAGIAVSIPCQVGDKVTIIAKAGSATAVDRGYSVTGGTLNTTNTSSNIDGTGILTVAGATGTWVYDATSTAVAITSVTGGMNILSISVSRVASTCNTYTVTGGTTATYAVTGLTPSTSYTYQIKATDAQPAETSPYTTAATISTTAVTNIPPVVSITSPTTGSCVTAGSTITLTATATDADGTVSGVQFYNGATLLGSGTQAGSTFTYSWVGVPAGSNSITAVATDNSAATTTSTVVTVNTIPTISGVTPASICGTGTVSLGAAASAGTINWYTAATGGASLGTGISFTTPSIASSTPYYVDATNNGCTTATRTSVLATVNPTAVITLTSVATTTNQTLCGNLAAIAPITYNLTGGATGATVTGLPAGVTSSVAAGVLTISGTPTVTGTFNYTVTTTGNTAPCTAATTIGTITINPIAVITRTSAAATIAQTVCGNLAAITPITYSLIGGATGATVTGLPAGVTGSVAAGVLTISGTPTATGTFNYTVTTTGHTAPCVAATTTGSITINPIAIITLTSGAATTNQTLCGNLAAITNIAYNLTGGATGATVTGLPAGVTSSVAAGVLTISGTPTATGTFNYTVTSTGQTAPCVAATTNGSITVNPIAVITRTSAAATTTQTLCGNLAAITPITYSLTGGATNATVTGLPAGVTSSVVAGVLTISGTPTVTGTFNYTVTTTGHTVPCVAATTTGSITINPIAVITLTSGVATTNQTLCGNLAAITNITYLLSGGATGATVTGLPASVTGSVAAGVLTISGTPTVTGTFNYTVTTTGNTAPCTAATTIGTITINPIAVITRTSAAATTAQTVCGNLVAITPITYSLTGGATGATVAGLPAGVTGSVAAGILTISGTPTVTGTFNYTVTTTGHTVPCVAVTTTGSITINPIAIITLTSGVATTNQSLTVSTAITNITYSLTGSATGATVTGLPTGITSNVAGGILTISGTPSVSGTFNYTITTTGQSAPCTGATLNGTITVNSLAVLTLTSAVATTSQTVCSSAATIAPITYTYSGSATGATVTGLPTGVTATVAAGVVTISGTATVTGIFNYTVNTTPAPAATASGTITINPAAVVALTSAAATTNQTLCGNLAAITNITYLLSGGATGATVTGLPAGVTGSVAAGVLTISGTPTATGTFNYTVTTTGNIAPCTAATTIGTITINPIAVITRTSAAATTAQTVCGNLTAITPITYSLTGGATNATVTGLPAGVTSSVVAGVLTISGTPTATGTFNYTVTSTGQTAPCTAATATGTITVNPIAVITLTSAVATTNQTLCGNLAVINNITYLLSGGATGATVSGLPAGVTSSVAAGVLTISGTPSVTGTFNYTVTTTGNIAPCTTTTAIGTITINPIAVITRTSAAATTAQTICGNLTAITPITYSLTGGATNATVTGLPAGVTSSVVAGVLTISGTPTATGTFNYTVTSTGQTVPCIAATSNGTITINAIPTISTVTPASRCGTGAVNLGATSSVGTINWYAAATGGASLGTGTSFTTPSISGNTTYYVDVTNASCTTATRTSVLATVNTIPTVTITGLGSGVLNCTTTTITLGSSIAASTYAWTKNALSAGSSPTLGVTTAGTYGLTITDGNGCSASASTVATTVDIAAPAVAITGLGSGIITCAFPSITLNSNQVAASYAWTKDAVAAGAASTLAASNAGVYGLTVTYANGCTATAATVTTTKDASIPTVTLTGATTGQVINCTTPSYTLGYTVSTGTVLNQTWSTTATTGTIIVSNAGTYNVSVNMTNGCSATSNSITLTKDIAAPVVTITGLGSGVINCTTPSITLGSSQVGTSYAWTKNAVPTGTGSTFAVTTAGTYGLMVTYANGCTATASTVATTVDNIAPAVAITGLGTGVINCTTPSITLGSSQVGSSYAWTNNAAPTGTGSTLAVTTAGTYGLMVTYANGCTASASTVATIVDNAAPAVAITGLGTGVINCTTPSITLSSSQVGTSYAWTKNAAPTGTVSTLAVTTAGTYGLMVTYANGCTASASTVATTVDNAAPAVAITGLGTGVINCTTPSITMSSSQVGTSYAWTKNAAPTGTVSTLAVTTAGTYGLMVTYANGCTASASTVATTVDNAAPAVAITGLGTGVINCTTPSITLSSSQVGTSYAWTKNAAPTGTGSTLAVTTAGTYGLMVTYANGCTASASTVATTVDNAAPAVAITGLGSGIITCAFPSITLSSSQVAASYAWTKDAVAAGAASTLAASNAGVFGLTVTYANGCTATAATVTTTKDASIPTVTLTGATTGAVINCNTPSYILGYTVSSGTVSGQIWSTTEVTPSISVSNAGTYNVEVTFSNGCSATSNSISLTKDIAAPAVSITGLGTGILTCAAPSITLSSSQIGASYAWTKNAVAAGSSSTLAATSADTYGLIVTYTNGCSATASTVNTTLDNAAPAVSITGLSSGIITCAVPTITLGSSQTASSYAWTKDAAAAGVSSTLAATSAGTYGLTVTYANGCTATASTVATTMDASIPTVTLTGATTGAVINCTTPSYTLGYTVSSGTVTGQIWSTTGATPSISVSNGGAYNVAVTFSNGCSATSNSISLTKDVAAPTVSINGLGAGVINCTTTGIPLSSSQTASSYAWTKDAVAFGTSSTANATNSGVYGLTVTYPNGCLATASTVTITSVACDASINNPSDKNQTVTVNTPVSNIVFVLGGSATTASVTGLPAGVTYNPTTNTISGTPTASGTFNYTVTTNGTNPASVNGTLTVTAAAVNISVQTSLTQKVQVGKQLDEVILTWTGGSYSDIDVTGLPAGVTYTTTDLSQNTGTITISGVPNNSSTYSIRTTDANGAIQNYTGTITVKGHYVYQEKGTHLLRVKGDLVFRLEVYATNGKYLSRKDGVNEIELDYLGSGGYVVRITDIDKSISSQKFVWKR